MRMAGMTIRMDAAQVFLNFLRKRTFELLRNTHTAFKTFRVPGGKSIFDQFLPVLFS